jgi:hypothetical protein
MGIIMKFKMAAALAVFCAASTAQAATQCFANTGTYGAVTVTATGSGCFFNTVAPAGPMGIWMSTPGASCTLTFDKPLAASSFRVTLDSINSGSTTRFSVNGAPYNAVPADILTTPLAPPYSTGAIAAVAGDVVLTPPAFGSGSLWLTNSPPAAITSLTVAYTGAPLGAFFRVCADDVGVAVAPAAGTSASIPTLSQWGLIAMSSLLALFAVSLLRRRG